LTGLVVATTQPEHQYARLLYEAMPGCTIVPAGAPDGDLARRLRGVDVLHLDWPEYWVGIDRAATERTIGAIRAAGARIVWTQHNLLPHRDRSAEARHVYALWARAADGVIHHSEYGKRIALATHVYPRARHSVIRHGHWGRCFPGADRTAVEHEEGWPPAPIRLAVVGQPRREKALQTVVDAFCRTEREDIQLVARVSPEVRVPGDLRLFTGYDGLDAARYYRRLSAVDGIILPFSGDSMLATGTAFDCIGGGIAAIASPWGFLEETFGDAAIWYDGSEAGLAACLESLRLPTLRAAGDAARELQRVHDWASAGARTAEAFEVVVATSPSASPPRP
jgi:glycosyltransferase involved in cell wall biosynthesis